MKLEKIKDRSLCLVVANHQICDHCKVVDLDIRRIEGGYICPICSKPGDTGHMFFDMNILTLINLIQEAFHTKPWKDSEFDNKKINAHSLSVLIFFCTLREVLLERLIYDLMCMHRLPKAVCERLYDDNRTYSDRMNRLFPSLIGLKSWKEALKQVETTTGRKHSDINDFLKKASDMRNEILHEGRKWAFEPHMKKSCLDSIPPLLGLYVDLHNVFLHPVYLKRIQGG